MVTVASAVHTPLELLLSQSERPPFTVVFVSHAWTSTLVIDAPAGKWTPASRRKPPEVVYLPILDTYVVVDVAGVKSTAGTAIATSEAVPYVLESGTSWATA